MVDPCFVMLKQWVHSHTLCTMESFMSKFVVLQKKKKKMAFVEGEKKKRREEGKRTVLLIKQ